MATSSQRVSRGFHRLAVFLAAIPLLVGGTLAVVHALNVADNGWARHKQLICASDYLIKLSDARRTALKNAQERREGETGHGPWEKYPIVDASTLPADQPPLMDERVDLKASGCSSWSEEVPTKVALNAREEKFNYAGAVASAIAFGLVLTLAATLAIYGLVRAIGWVIGGFATS